MGYPGCHWPQKGKLCPPKGWVPDEGGEKHFTLTQSLKVATLDSAQAEPDRIGMGDQEELVWELKSTTFQGWDF